MWAPADAGSAVATWHALVGPWSRGAETLLHDGPFDPLERLDLIYRLGVTVCCMSPAEYAAVAELREVARFQPPQLRRLVSTGDYLDPDVSAVFEQAWGLTIHDGYSQAETGVVVANSGEAGFKPGSIGLPLPGHQVAVIDDQGNELPPGVEGELAVRGRPPTLFAGYWESPEETKQAFRGDWYVTGDIATVDQEGFFWFVARNTDMITSKGEHFGPHESERALRAHEPSPTPRSSASATSSAAASSCARSSSPPSGTRARSSWRPSFARRSARPFPTTPSRARSSSSTSCRRRRAARSAGSSCASTSSSADRSGISRRRRTPSRSLTCGAPCSSRGRGRRPKPLPRPRRRPTFPPTRFPTTSSGRSSPSRSPPRPPPPRSLRRPSSQSPSPNRSTGAGA